MNKKFIKISLIICIPIVLLISFFTITVKSINDEPFEEPEEKISIKYNGYKENKNRYTISILVKNNSKDIASLNDMELSFDYKFDNEDNVDENGYCMQNNVYIKGSEIDIFDDNKIYGIDPGTEKEIIFEIPKGIKFDEEIFDIKRPTIHYNVNFYKFRTGSRSLMLGSGGIGGSITLNREALN